MLLLIKRFYDGLNLVELILIEKIIDVLESLDKVILIQEKKPEKNLAIVHEKVTNCRTDWFWKLAHQLTKNYDYLYFETLNLKGMQRL